MKRHRLLWAVSIGIACLAVLGVTSGLQGWLPNPVFRLQVRADLGTWILIGSIVVALGLLLTIAVRTLMRRFLQRSLERAQDEYSLARRRFIRRLDHELKNPLAAIRAQLAYLSQSAGKDLPESVLGDMLIQVERLGRLISRLRKLVDLEEQEIERLPVDVASLLQEVVEASQAHPNYPARRIRLFLPRAPWPLPAVNGDRDLLWQVFFNLLDNALKFTRPGGLIEIRAFEDERSVVIEVADTGCGITQDDLPYIFEELYRGTNAQGYEGNGLGLALVNTVVKRHGGHIQVRSRPDRGTIFIVRLPVVS